MTNINVKFDVLNILFGGHPMLDCLDLDSSVRRHLVKYLTVDSTEF